MSQFIEQVERLKSNFSTGFPDEKDIREWHRQLFTRLNAGLKRNSMPPISPQDIEAACDDIMDRSISGERPNKMPNLPEFVRFIRRARAKRLRIKTLNRGQAPEQCVGDMTDAQLETGQKKVRFLIGLIGRKLTPEILDFILKHYGDDGYKNFKKIYDRQQREAAELMEARIEVEETLKRR